MSSDISVSSRRATSIRCEDFGEMPAKRKAVKPERNLLAAVLGRAILDLYGDTVTDRIIVARARNWLNGPLDFEQEFSFAWVAKQLDLDPVTIRHYLHTYAKEPETLIKCLNYLR